MQNRHSHIDVKKNATGRWRAILVSAGIAESKLINKHGPCPFCGGKDRWRWDDKNRSGSGICNQCGAGDGFYVLTKALNLNCRSDFPKLLEYVATFLNGKNPSPTASHHSQSECSFDPHTGRMRRAALQVWNDSEALSHPRWPMGIMYLKKRGLDLNTLPKAVRIHPDCASMGANGITTGYPALIAKVEDRSGNICGIHRTYLTAQGEKAPVPNPKKSLGQIKEGAVRLDDADDHVCIGEGIETMLAVQLLTGDPVWSVLSATGVMSFEPPQSVRFVDIYADRDANSCGLKAAHSLMVRLLARGISVRTFLPPRPIPSGMKSWDWLNEYLLRKGVPQ